MKHLKMKSPTFVFDVETFIEDPRPFWWILGRLLPKDLPQPTSFHYFVTLLQRHGLLLRYYTQNIDDLETAAGMDNECIIHCHGVLTPCHCLDCGREVQLSCCIDAIQKNMHEDLDDYRKAVVPKCPFCHQDHFKTDVSFFGEKLPSEYRRNYQEDFSECDLLIVCGSSMQVTPVCNLPQFLRQGVPCFLMNKEKVKEKGNKAKQIIDNINNAFSITGADYSGVFDFENKDSFIGGDIQDNCIEIIKHLGWEEEFEELKQETDFSNHPLSHIISNNT